MNRCKINGTLAKTGDTFGPRHIYSLEVTRAGGGIDTLLAVSADGDLPEGRVTVEGTVRAEYFRGKGVLVYVEPETTAPSDEAVSTATVTGTLKNEPSVHTTKKGNCVCTLILITEGGPVPVVLWGKNAKNAPEAFKPGDIITAEGRLQSREYPAKGGGKKTTYEISAGRRVPEIKKEQAHDNI